MQFPRLFWWLVATVLLLAVIGLFYQQQIPVSLYKLPLIAMASVIDYWLDRSIFPYSRPDSFLIHGDLVEAACDIDLNSDCKAMPFQVVTDDVRF